MKTAGLIALSAISLGMAATVTAEDALHRQHEAHQHGVVEWHIAQDGDVLLVEITAPGADVVGFEHAPENNEQANLIHQAEEKLAAVAGLFSINASADCNLIEHKIAQTLMEEHDAHEGHDHSAHGHDDHHDDHDSHDKHIDEHDDHNDHTGHDHHDDHGQEGSHGEFSAQYTFNCNNPAEIKTVTTNWFDTFSTTEKITVQALTDKGVVAGDLSPAARSFTF
ncbi:zinc uptake protein ZrgA [Enterovibrio nigricans]|uniref:Zinc-binding protein n=1 Tax=Enterovibrio nigricans DSM 22720 TaxID=1121868 RepID=A0A1T4W1A3_9GAMM|nr:DUF2796 domain-containing protein [Enterovibrio nigricans]PKF49022.1 DUF2796 domain-containing protein [Enterovibrio nigricans]SKA71032.1 Protein of unknown function [Enterovibrio nigricans DSM 22720]